MTNFETKQIEIIVDTLINERATKVTKYLDPKLIIRAVRRRFKANKTHTGPSKILAGHNIEMTLTIGRPNYQERKFVKLCQKSGEPFPIKKLQIKH